MRTSPVIRRILVWIIAAFATFVVSAAGLVAAIDAGHGRALLIRYAETLTGRRIQIDGVLQTHLLSLNPSLIAEHISIGNPPWMPSGLAAEVGKLSVALRWPGFDHPAGIIGLEVQAANLYPWRISKAQANWQWTDPARRRINKHSLILRSLSMPNAHVVLRDDVRQLQYVGTISAQGPGGLGPAQALRIEGSGQLNGRAVSFEITADPLATASHRAPYHFAFSERSSGSRLEARGTLPQPFAYDILDTTFEAAGPDLKDLYFLTGVHLIETRDYRLSGILSLRGTYTKFSDLLATSGSSDVRGTVAIDSGRARPSFALDLNSRLLSSSDIGLRASGRSTEPVSPLLLSDAMLNPQVLRNRDAVVRYRADRVQMGRLPLDEVSLNATIDHDVLTVAPLLAGVLGGRVNGHLTLDARKSIPKADVDFRLAGLQLERIEHKLSGHPPVEGPMQARVIVTGTGSSVHQVASSANGTVTVEIAQGALRDSFAELTGVDLRGLGLLLTRNEREVPIRCAVAKFQARDGTLIAQTLVADTAPVLITGEGQIKLDTETLDLTIRGNPKHVRLFRLRAPILVRGPLTHPSIHVETSKSVLLIVDSGHAKDTDCPTLLTRVSQ